MRIIENETVYDSFEEISNACPIGNEQSQIVRYQKYTWDDDREISYVEYNQITICSGYFYNGDYWKSHYSTRREEIKNN